VAKRGPQEFGGDTDLSLRSLPEQTCLLRLAGDLCHIRGEAFEQIEQPRNRAAQVARGLNRAISRQAE
jgi:hypothetical protein